MKKMDFTEKDDFAKLNHTYNKCHASTFKYALKSMIQFTHNLNSTLV